LILREKDDEMSGEGFAIFTLQYQRSIFRVHFFQPPHSYPLTISPWQTSLPSSQTIEAYTYTGQGAHLKMNDLQESTTALFTAELLADVDLLRRSPSPGRGRRRLLLIVTKTALEIADQSGLVVELLLEKKNVEKTVTRFRIGSVK
jgi:hypothetical protein